MGSACAAALSGEVRSSSRIATNTRRDDAYTAQAVGHGIDALLREYGASPDGSPPMPEAIEQRVVNMPEDFAERFRAPAHFGQMHAFNLINEFKQAASMTDLTSKATEPMLFLGPGRLSNIGRELRKAVRDINRKGKSK